MNRTFLIFLMIGSAMLIAVIGQQNPTTQHDYAPWDVKKTESGSLHVFGITLGKTTIQEANQIFSSFAESQLILHDADSKTLSLIAIHDELVISGVITDLQLTYQLDQETLQNIYSELIAQPDSKLSELKYKLTPDIELLYLNTPISSIAYLPSVDYGDDEIRQRFGLATEEKTINQTERVWLYPDLGLEMHLYTDKTDHFIYKNL